MTNKLGNKTIIFTLSKVFTLLITLVIAKLLSDPSFRSLEEFGTYSQLISITILISTVFMLGMPTAITYFISKNDGKDKEQYLSLYYTLTLIIGILSGIVFAILLPFFSQYYSNDDLSMHLYFALAYPLIYIINSNIENVLIAYDRLKLIVILKSISGILLLSCVLLCKFLNLSFSLYLICYLCVEGLIAIVDILLVNIFCSRIRFVLKGFKKFLTFALPLGFSSIIGLLCLELDKLVIGYFFPTDIYAVYTNASRELPITIISTSIATIIIPQVALYIKNDNDNEALKLWKNSVSISFWIISLLSFGVIAFAPQVMKLLYSNMYLSGVWVFRIYAFSMLIRCTYFGLLLNAKEKSKFILFSSILSLVINTCLNILLIKIIGLEGPAIATVLSLFFTAFIQLIWISREFKVKLLDVFPWKDAILFSLINVLLLLLFTFLANSINLGTTYIDVIFSILLGVVWCLIYVSITFNRIIYLLMIFNGGTGVKKNYLKCLYYYFYVKIFLKKKYDKKYFTGRFFTGKLKGIFSEGYKWAYVDYKENKKLNINIDSKYPISPRNTVIRPNNIFFDPNDLNNFQGFGCYFQAIGEIHIGRGTYIASNVGIITANHNFDNLDEHYEAKDVIIGNGCWIGMNSVILPGVILGDNVIVGAGSVVTKSFESNQVICGNPARKIRDL